MLLLWFKTEIAGLHSPPSDFLDVRDGLRGSLLVFCVVSVPLTLEGTTRTVPILPYDVHVRKVNGACSCVGVQERSFKILFVFVRHQYWTYVNEESRGCSQSVRRVRILC